ncbi:MAG: dihydropteroate synthase [Gloeocapsa sp. DLM2.Bin57]|nr:MAG: dihydropteroate synthase [Gloeocapsa sp. DLM2.Bin57]
MSSLTIRNHSFNWGSKTYLMGILNVTPDSFSDGGEFNNLSKAIAQAEKLVNSGADLLDIGGQSTRPGAEIIPLATELERVIPVVKELRSRLDIPISVDTTRSQVASAAIAAGADLINDISGGTIDPEMFTVVANLGVPLILMHSRGTPQTMQQLTQYDDLITEIKAFLAARINTAVAMGIKRSHLIIDPGIGFAKNYDQNRQILGNLEEFKYLETPILVGPSRKSFIGQILGKSDPKDRVWGTAAACCLAIAGGADLLRVHDVREMSEVCTVFDAIYRN